MKNEISLKKAAVINGAGKYSKIFLSVIVNAVLARLLTPNDFGIVAIITVFSTFFSTFSDMGFGVAVVQNKELTKSEIEDIYSFTIYMSFILAIIFDLAAYPISLFYKNRIYINLSLLLSLSLFFNAINMVPNGILNRQKKFKVIAVRTFVVYLISAILTILAAFWGFRYYALILQAILSSFFSYMWNYLTLKPHFKLKFKMSSVNKVLGYSSYQFAFNVVNYFSRNLDNLLTGKFMGNTNLGYYDKAYTLMLYPVNNLTGVISPVLHPILSDFQNNKDIIYKKYLKVFKFLFCLGVFVTCICFLCSKEIITIMYGNNWNKSIICFQLLSIAILPQMLNSSASGIFQALGNTRLLFQNSCINTFITIVAILIGVFCGKDIMQLSFWVSIAYICHFITVFFMLITMGFKFSMFKFIKDNRQEILILIMLSLSVLLYPLRIDNIILAFLSKLTYLFAVFIVLLIITKEYKIFIRIIR